jgi:hypothetical protein
VSAISRLLITIFSMLWGYQEQGEKYC